MEYFGKIDLNQRNRKSEEKKCLGTKLYGQRLLALLKEKIGKGECEK